MICAGVPGADGVGCTVEDNGDGTKTVSCTDGTSAVVGDGKEGAAGAAGKDALVRTEPASDHCTGGGIAVLGGVDENENGVLDDDEITHRSDICR